MLNLAAWVKGDILPKDSLAETVLVSMCTGCTARTYLLIHSLPWSAGTGKKCFCFDFVMMMVSGTCHNYKTSFTVSLPSQSQKSLFYFFHATSFPHLSSCLPCTVNEPRNASLNPPSHSGAHCSCMRLWGKAEVAVWQWECEGLSTWESAAFLTVGEDAANTAGLV